MALTEVGQVVKPPKRGGGGLGGALGSLAGTVLGGGIGFLAGGPAGALAGAGLGGTIGGAAGPIAGEAIDPSSGGSVAPKIERTPLSTFAENNPQVQLAQLNSGIKALQNAPIPMSTAAEYANTITSARQKLIEQMQSLKG